MSQEWQVGSMYVRFEEPDTLFTRNEGEVDGETMRSFHRMANELAATHGKLLLIGDMSNAKGMTAEARKVSAENAGKSPFLAMAFFGSSFAMRTALNMMMMVRAGQLLGRVDAPMQFVPSEEEARAWLSGERKTAKSA